MKSTEYVKAIKAGREVVITPLCDKSHELTTVFWMVDGTVMSWNRELGMMERGDMSRERFASHCDRMREDGKAVMIRG